MHSESTVSLQQATSDEDEEEESISGMLINGNDYRRLLQENTNNSGDENDDDSLNSARQSHCHYSLLMQPQSRRAEWTLIAVALLSAFFIVAEFTGGVLAHSLAIMTDAGHMLSDLLSFIISIFAIRVARSPASRRLSFGFERAEVLGATLSIIIIWILTTVLVMLAIQKIINKEYDVEPNTMLITAAVGLVFNIVMGAVLYFGGHSHSHGGLRSSEDGSSHGHSHAHTHAHATAKNVNVRAALIHVIGDLVQSIGVLVAAVVIKFTGWQLADPICTFLFSIIVLITSITVIRDIFYVLMEGTPRHIDYAKLSGDLSAIEGVRAVHSLHVWSLNMDKTALSVHLAIDDPNRAIATMQSASRAVRLRHPVHMATIQVEPFDDLMATCEFCQPLQ